MCLQEDVPGCEIPGCPADILSQKVRNAGYQANHRSAAALAFILADYENNFSNARQAELGRTLRSQVSNPGFPYRTCVLTSVRPLFNPAVEFPAPGFLFQAGSIFRHRTKQHLFVLSLGFKRWCALGMLLDRKVVGEKDKRSNASVHKFQPTLPTMKRLTVAS